MKYPQISYQNWGYSGVVLGTKTSLSCQRPANPFVFKEFNRWTGRSPRLDFLLGMSSNVNGSVSANIVYVGMLPFPKGTCDIRFGQLWKEVELIFPSALLLPFPLLVHLHKLQLCELQPQSEQCTVISAAFDTSFCNSPYWFTLPPRAPHSPSWLWLSISNLAIFVALLWALINNCVCHRLLSLPTRRLSGLDCLDCLAWCRGSSSTSYNVAVLLPPDGKVGTNKVLLCFLCIPPPPSPSIPLSFSAFWGYSFSFLFVLSTATQSNCKGGTLRRASSTSTSSNRRWSDWWSLSLISCFGVARAWFMAK